MPWIWESLFLNAEFFSPSLSLNDSSHQFAKSGGSSNYCLIPLSTEEGLFSSIINDSTKHDPKVAGTSDFWMQFHQMRCCWWVVNYEENIQSLVTHEQRNFISLSDSYYSAPFALFLSIQSHSSADEPELPIINIASSALRSFHRYFEGAHYFWATVLDILGTTIISLGCWLLYVSLVKELFNPALPCSWTWSKPQVDADVHHFFKTRFELLSC